MRRLSSVTPVKVKGCNAKMWSAIVFVTCLHVVTLWRLHLRYMEQESSDSVSTGTVLLGAPPSTRSDRKQQQQRRTRMQQRKQAKQRRQQQQEERRQRDDDDDEEEEEEEEEERPDRINSLVDLPDSYDLPDALRIDPWRSTILAEGHPNNKIKKTETPYDNCCGHWSSRKVSKNAHFSSICFTPNACKDTGDELYPYQSQADKETYFRPRGKDKPVRTLLTGPCKELYKDRQQPPVAWNTSDPFPFPNNLPPPGCSIVTTGGGSGAFPSLYIVPHAKLAFCGIPKVGISNWLQFLRFVMGARDYASFPHGKPDLHVWAFDKLEPDLQSKIWNDPEWTFAAFLRNPAERLLSAYLDKLKVEKHNGVIAKKMGFDESFTFEVFLEHLERDLPEFIDCSKHDEFASQIIGLSWCTDPHWRPQTWSCGLSEKIDRFDFLGSLDHAEAHTKALLEKVGLWESHGKHFRTGKSKRTTGFGMGIQLGPLQDEFEKIPPDRRQVGFQQHSKHHERQQQQHQHRLAHGRITANHTFRTAWDTVGHSKSASSKIEAYYTPELFERVSKLFAADAAVWEFLDNDDGSWVTGRDVLPGLLRDHPPQPRPAAQQRLAPDDDDDDTKGDEEEQPNEVDDDDDDTNADEQQQQNEAEAGASVEIT